MTFNDVAASGMNMVGSLAVLGITSKIAHNTVKSIPTTKTKKVVPRKISATKSSKKMKGIFR